METILVIVGIDAGVTEIVPTVRLGPAIEGVAVVTAAMGDPTAITVLDGDNPSLVDLKTVSAIDPSVPVHSGGASSNEEPLTIASDGRSEARRRQKASQMKLQSRRPCGGSAGHIGVGGRQHKARRLIIQ